MRTNLTLLVFLLLIETISGQILSISENWPNPSWSVSGTYTSAALLANPTVATSLKYDTPLVSPPGSASFLTAASPFFSLQSALMAMKKYW